MPRRIAPLSWLQQESRVELRELETLKPDARYAGRAVRHGANLARQIHEFLPAVHLLGTASLYNGAFPIQVGAMGAEGWSVTNVARDAAASRTTAAGSDRCRRRFGTEPSRDSVTASTGATVIAIPVHRVVQRGWPVTRASVRGAITASRLPDALSGPIAFDPDRVEHPAVSVYQVQSSAFRHVETILPAGVKDVPVKASQ
jgi:ABC-type branched-subunit amino acid transport system substrate-binding protein